LKGNGRIKVRATLLSLVGDISLIKLEGQVISMTQVWQGNYGSILYGTKDTPTLYIIKNTDNTLTVGSVDIKDNKVTIYSRVNSTKL